MTSCLWDQLPSARDMTLLYPPAQFPCMPVYASPHRLAIPIYLPHRFAIIITTATVCPTYNPHLLLPNSQPFPILPHLVLAWLTLMIWDLCVLCLPCIRILFSHFILLWDLATYLHTAWFTFFLLHLPALSLHVDSVPCLPLRFVPFYSLAHPMPVFCVASSFLVPTFPIPVAFHDHAFCDPTLVLCSLPTATFILPACIMYLCKYSPSKTRELCDL